MKKFQVFGNRHCVNPQPFFVKTIEAKSLADAQELAEVMYEEAPFAVYSVVEEKE